MNEPTQTELFEAAKLILGQAERWKTDALGNHHEHMRRVQAFSSLELTIREVIGMGSGMLPASDAPVVYAVIDKA